MKKVLVAVDGSDKSLEAADYALSIASRERTEDDRLHCIMLSSHSFINLRYKTRCFSGI